MERAWISQKAFTIIELLCVITMIALILGTGAPALVNQLNDAKVKRAKYEIRLIAGEIEDYIINHEEYPDSLSDIGYGHRTDPWGNEYQYLRIDGGDKNITGKVAKVYGDKPLNIDFDLYSMGRDGHTASPLTAGPVQDDVLRLDSGGYLGTGADYLAKAKEEKKGARNKPDFHFFISNLHSKFSSILPISAPSTKNTTITSYQ